MERTAMIHCECGKPKKSDEVACIDCLAGPFGDYDDHSYEGYTIIGYDRGDPIILCPGCHTEPCHCDTMVREDY
jgi:hypothetical protein